MSITQYEFHNPVKIISGHNGVDNLAFELKQKGAGCPMIITDPGVVAAGLLKIITNAFADAGLTVGAVFDQTPPDSSLDIVKKISGIYKQNHCDSIVAVGGRLCH